MIVWVIVCIHDKHDKNDNIVNVAAAKSLKAAIGHLIKNYQDWAWLDFRSIEDGLRYQITGANALGNQSVFEISLCVLAE